MLVTLENDEKVAVTMIRNTKNKDLIEYYVGNVKIGVLETDVMSDNILVLQNTLENELISQIKDNLNSLPREEIEEEADLTRQVDTYMKKFGKREEIARGIDLVKLDDDIEKTEENEQEEEIISKEDIEEKEEDKTSKITDVNIKQTVDLNERANDMHDVRKWLGLPQDVAKIGVIESYQMKDLKDEEGKSYDNVTTRYSLVAIGKDGKVRPLSEFLPGLEQRDSTGNNPTRESFQVDAEGRVEKDAVLSEYQFGSKIIQIDNKEMGRIEINIGEEARNSTKAMGVQLRAENTVFATDRTTRSVIGEYEENGEDNVEENIEEAEKHPEPEDDKMDERDIDGDLSTKSHIHVENSVYLEDGTELSFESLAKRWGLYNDMGKPDAEYAREKYMEKQYENLDKSTQEIVEDLDEEFEDPRIENQR